MPKVRYLTHPQVAIDPAVPTPDWGLSDLGRARADNLARSGLTRSTRLIVSSAERKATETAAIIAAAHGAAVLVREAMHENDRSATGYLPPPAFEAAADEFFAKPLESFRGWERAVDAQARIVREVDAALAEAADLDGDILLVGHGAVGALLLCALSGLPISRASDQPAGGGNLFAFDRDARIMHHGWRSIESLIDGGEAP
jgi:broad specificity phosphatase PhoE